jgi:hypothetical protein
MNKHKNGTYVVGAKGSYQYLLSGFTDLLKSKPKAYEVFHYGQHLKKAGFAIGLSKERIENDWKKAHKV